MRTSIKIDHGWSLLVAQTWMVRIVITFAWIIEISVLRLQVHPTECSILYHFIHHIFYMPSLEQLLQKSLKKATEGSVRKSQPHGKQETTATRRPSTGPTAPSRGALSTGSGADAVICSAALVICGGRRRCSGHFALVNFRGGFWRCTSRAGLLSSLSQ